MMMILTALRSVASLFPLWVWVLAAGLAYGSYQHHRANGMEAKAEQEKIVAQQQAERADSEKREREKEQTYADTIQNVATAYGERVAQARTAAVGARTELDRLRNAIDAVPPSRCAGSDAATAGRADDARITGQLLGQCAATLQGVAEEADRLEAKLTGLQDYERKRQEAIAPAR